MIFSNILKLLSLAVALRVLTTQKQTSMKVSEAIQLVKDTRDQLIKAKGEILRKIAKLENGTGDNELTPDQIEIVQSLRAQVQSLDDVVPDETEVEKDPAPGGEEGKPGEPGKPAGENGEGGEGGTGGAGGKGGGSDD